MNSGRWEKSEHDKFIKAMKKFTNWKDIANAVGTRSAIQCRSHDQKIRKKIENKIKNNKDINKVYKEHDINKYKFIKKTKKC